MNKISVMIIDEQPFFRAGVRQALSQESDFKILDCDPTQDPLGLIEANLPSIVLLGSDLGTHSGLELGRTIARYYPNTKVVMLSPNPNDEELFEVIKTAAVACLSKNINTPELVNTIKRACGGEYPINESVMNRPKIAVRVLEQFQSTSPIAKTMAAVIAPLTNRETQIMRYIADGNTNKEIGHVLGISEQTIKSHVSAILRKLNANDRAHAVALAIRSSWIPPEGTAQELSQ